jgi:hypothetical protein
MTIEALRGKSTRARRTRRQALPIGEADANIFNCPACARPLAVGTPRCPECNTRLIDGIRATRAIGFMAIGVLIGAIAGAGTVGVVAAVALAEPVAVVDTSDITGPVSSGAPAASAPVVAPDPTIPGAALAALRQSTLLNQRLVVDGDRLSAALAAKKPSAVEIARILRVLAASAAFGDRIAPDVAVWSDGQVVSEGLTDFYSNVGATAREGLTASINNTKAYVAAGKAMKGVLAGLDDLDAEARVLAAWADVSLPPLQPETEAP